MQNIRRASFILSSMFGLTVFGYGVYLAARGQNCHSYNDYACAFGAMFSFVFIPLGLTILLSIVLAGLPLKIIKLMGNIFSIILGLPVLGLSCFFTLWGITAGGESLLSGESGFYFLSMLFTFLGSASLMGVGVTGILQQQKSLPKFNQPRPKEEADSPI